MKKMSLVLVAAAVMSLAACNKTPEAQNVIDAGDNSAAMLENTADNLDAMADNTTNAMAANTLSAASDNADAAADNVQEMAHDKADNMTK